MNYTIYDPITGKIIELLSTPHDDVAEHNLKGKIYISGYYHMNEYYIQDGQPIAYPLKPTDNLNYQFDYNTKTWQVDLIEQEQIMRSLRNQALAQIDRVNPVWYASLTQDQQQELVVYRQQLLDVPQQAGFPTDIVWPAKPTWL
jgi:hypothetical protein